MMMLIFDCRFCAQHAAAMAIQPAEDRRAIELVPISKFPTVVIYQLTTRTFRSFRAVAYGLTGRLFMSFGVGESVRESSLVFAC